MYGLRSNSEGQLGGKDFVLAVNTDNNVIFSFGGNIEGQFGRHVDMDVNVYHKPDTILYFQTNNLSISQISCGYYHTIVLTSNGQVFGWGSNKQGQVGCGNKSFQLDSTPVEFVTEYQISKIECNEYTSLAITCEGQVLIWRMVDNKNSISIRN
ncbi:unnamed protein product, partial [Oppiella nova]